MGLQGIIIPSDELVLSTKYLWAVFDWTQDCRIFWLHASKREKLFSCTEKSIYNNRYRIRERLPSWSWFYSSYRRRLTISSRLSSCSSLFRRSKWTKLHRRLGCREVWQQHEVSLLSDVDPTVPFTPSFGHSTPVGNHFANSQRTQESQQGLEIQLQTLLSPFRDVLSFIKPDHHSSVLAYSSVPSSVQFETQKSILPLTKS